MFSPRSGLCECGLITTTMSNVESDRLITTSIKNKTKKVASGQSTQKKSVGAQPRQQVARKDSMVTDYLLSDYIETIPNVYDRIRADGSIPRAPGSAGVPTAQAQAANDLNFVANVPMYAGNAISTTQVGGLVLASNSADRTRLMVSAGAGVDGIVNLSMSTTADILAPSEADISGSIDGANSTWYDAPGICELSKFDAKYVQFYVPQPNWNGATAIIADITDVIAGGLQFSANILDDYEGLVGIRVGFYNGVWNYPAQATAYFYGGAAQTPISIPVGAGSNYSAVRVQLASTVPQLLRYHINIYSSSLNTSLSFPNVVNLLQPQPSLFQTEINGMQLKEYYDVAHSEVITNETTLIQRAGNVVSCSMQKFVGMYNVSQATDLHSLIMMNYYHTYSGPADKGASGFGFPTFMQTLPLPYSARKFASDVRAYLVECPVEYPQTFVIKYASAISIIGQRSGSTVYRIVSYPDFWPQVIRAIAMINPMQSNDAHETLVSRAYSYVANWLKSPSNRQKLASGVVTATDLVGQAVGAIAPRVGGGIQLGSKLLGGIIL